MIHKKLLQKIQKDHSNGTPKAENPPSEHKHMSINKFYKNEEEPDMAEMAKKKPRMTVEDKETREARKKEQELEWKRQLKEMKERKMKAEIEVKRRESLEGHITFEKIGSQKVIKVGKDGQNLGEIKQEAVDKERPPVKLEKDRRRSETGSEKERRRVKFNMNKSLDDLPKEKALKRELSIDRDESPKKLNSKDTSVTKKV